MQFCQPGAIIHGARHHNSDITIDETTGLKDDDVNSTVPPHSTNTTLQYLLSLDDPGGLTSPEVAFQADFVQATATKGKPSPQSFSPRTPLEPRFPPPTA